MCSGAWCSKFAAVSGAGVFAVTGGNGVIGAEDWVPEWTSTVAEVFSGASGGVYMV
jgi:hypothetical protein